MPTCSDMIARALRRLRVIDAIENPAAEDAEAAMVSLQDLLNRYVTAARGRLTDVYVTDAYEAGENEIIRRSAAQTITYASRIDNDRDPYDGSLVIVTGTPRDSRVYDADRGAWFPIEDLALSDECPFGLRDAAGISAAIAQDAADTFGVTLTPRSYRDAARGRMMLSGVIGGPLPYIRDKYY